MPYYHRHCGGEIRWIPFVPWPPRCDKCGKGWNPLVIYGPPRKDMQFIIERQPTTYAKWGDKVPGAGGVAGWLPNWPRWARLLSTGIFIVVIGGGLYLWLR